MNIFTFTFICFFINFCKLFDCFIMLKLSIKILLNKISSQKVKQI